jgi:hypothetical protein
MSSSERKNVVISCVPSGFLCGYAGSDEPIGCLTAHDLDSAYERLKDWLTMHSDDDGGRGGGHDVETLPALSGRAAIVGLFTEERVRELIARIKALDTASLRYVTLIPTEYSHCYVQARNVLFTVLAQPAEDLHESEAINKDDGGVYVRLCCSAVHDGYYIGQAAFRKVCRLPISSPRGSTTEEGEPAVSTLRASSLGQTLAAMVAESIFERAPIDTRKGLLGNILLLDTASDVLSAAGTSDAAVAARLATRAEFKRALSEDARVAGVDRNTSDSSGHAADVRPRAPPVFAARYTPQVKVKIIGDGFSSAPTVAKPDLETWLGTSIVANLSSFQRRPEETIDVAASTSTDSISGPWLPAWGAAAVELDDALEEQAKVEMAESWAALRRLGLHEDQAPTMWCASEPSSAPPPSSSPDNPYFWPKPSREAEAATAAAEEGQMLCVDWLFNDVWGHPNRNLAVPTPMVGVGWKTPMAGLEEKLDQRFGKCLVLRFQNKCLSEAIRVRLRSPGKQDEEQLGSAWSLERVCSHLRRYRWNGAPGELLRCRRLLHGWTSPQNKNKSRSHQQPPRAELLVVEAEAEAEAEAGAGAAKKEPPPPPPPLSAILIRRLMNEPEENFRRVVSFVS